MTYARRQIGARVEPAHLNAPPRLRQSHIREPFNSAPILPMETPGFWARLWGRR